MYMTEKEVAEHLSVSVYTVKRWRLRQGGGPPFVMLRGRMVRYNRDDFLKWLEDQKGQPKAS